MGKVQETILMSCLVILAVIGVTFALLSMKSILIPFVFAIFLYFITAPVMEFLSCKMRLPKWVALTMTLLIIILFFTGIVALLGISLTGFIQASGRYQTQVLQTFDKINANLDGYGFKMDLSLLRQYITEIPILPWIRGISGSVVGIIGNIILIIIFTLFLILGKKTPIELESQPKSKSKRKILNDEVQNRITRYINTKFFTSSLTGLLVTVILSLLNVQLAFLFGIMTFFLNFIPSIGSIIAIIMPIPVIFLQYGFGWMFACAIIIPGIIQFTIGNIVEPKLMGEKLGLHPVVVLLSLLFWGYVWGVPGMFLSVPITAIIKLLLDQSKSTKVFADILEGDLS